MPKSGLCFQMSWNGINEFLCYLYALTQDHPHKAKKLMDCLRKYYCKAYFSHWTPPKIKVLTCLKVLFVCCLNQYPLAMFAFWYSSDILIRVEIQPCSARILGRSPLPWSFRAQRKDAFFYQNNTLEGVVDALTLSLLKEHLDDILKNML